MGSVDQPKNGGQTWGVAMRSDMSGSPPKGKGSPTGGSGTSYISGMSSKYPSGRSDTAPYATRAQAEDDRANEKSIKDKALTRATLEQTIENEAIPRLLLARTEIIRPQDHAQLNEVAISEQMVEDFVKLVRTKDITTALDYVERLQQDGTQIETIWLDLLGPSAVLLGEMWNRDECDFLEVTLCTWRLHEILRSTTTLSNNIMESRTPKRRILIASLPGEQHSFGLAIIEAMFRRSGWHVWSWPGASTQELTRLVETEWFAVIGLSLSASERIDDLSGVIHSLRRASQNRSAGFVVGGPTFVEHPEFAARVGANAAATNGRQAILQAHNLLALLP